MRNELKRMLGAAALGAILAATPMTAGFHGGGLSLTQLKAFAKDGGGGGNSGSGSGGGSGSSGGGSGGGSGGSHGGNSGGSGSGGSGSSGSGGSGSSHSGSSGGSSGGGDDHGGSGGSGRGGTDDAPGDDHGGSGGGGRGGADDAAGDDHGGGGRGADDRGAAPAASGGGAARGGTLRVVDFERSADGVEVTYSNGVREEISRGRFEQKDASGRTLIERPVTDADLKRIARNTQRSGIVPVPFRTEATRVEASGSAIEVTYGTGWREQLDGGRYELKDPNNNTVIERVATPADISRLRALAGG